MTKFARLNIIWQRRAFLTAAVLDAEHLYLILLPQEKMSTPVFCFSEHLSNQWVLRIL